MNNPPPCALCRSTETTFFGEKNGHKLYCCLTCELMFVHPIPKNLSDVYGKEYFKKEAGNTFHGYTDYDKDKEPMRSVFEKYLARAEKLVLGRRVFDVGAATGYVLDIAKRRGWQTFGSELSDYAGRVAMSRGHSMTIGSLTSTSSLPTVDLVMMWDVLEHVDEPRAYITAVNHMLTEKGILMISTPDKNSMWSRMMGMRWHLIVPPEHVYYYSPKNMRALLSECGFEILEIAKPSKRFSVSYIFSQLAQWQRLSVWKYFARITDNSYFRFFSLPINLYDNMFVIARKK